MNADRLCALACAVLVAGTLLGAGRLPGAEAAVGLRAWWTERAFEQAVADLDWARMATLGEALLEDTGAGEALQLAAYRMGTDGTALTQGRVPADVLAWADETEQLVLDAQASIPDPWALRYLQAMMLVQRVYPVSGDPRHLEEGLTLLQGWMAAGGGLRAPGGPTGASYRALMRLPDAQRAAALRGYFFK